MCFCGNTMRFRMITRIAVKMQVRHLLLISVANSTCFFDLSAHARFYLHGLFSRFVRMSVSCFCSFRWSLLPSSSTLRHAWMRKQLSKVWHAVDNAANKSSFALRIRNCRKRCLPRRPDRRKRKIRAEKKFFLQNTWVCSREQIDGLEQGYMLEVTMGSSGKIKQV